MKAFIAVSGKTRYKGGMTRSFLTLALLVSAFTSPAYAGDARNPTHVVELFTSQGCSSCPPANKFVGKIAEENPNALVLSYGVSYWDYLGWKDTFGDPKFTQRQREYRDAFGAPNIYTPQIILAGSAHSPRYSKSDVESVALPESDVLMEARRMGDWLYIDAENTPEGAILDIVSFWPGEQEVDVKRGENRGRTVKVTNVVADVKAIDWDGKTAKIKQPLQEGMSYAFLIHHPETAKILKATVLD